MVQRICVTRDCSVFTLVDDEDYTRLVQYRWHLHRSRRKTYVVRQTSAGGKKRNIYMHREIMGEEPFFGAVVHHKNGDSLDNRKSVNLEWTTVELNAVQIANWRDGGPTIITKQEDGIAA